jgi:hypothetical protein
VALPLLDCARMRGASAWAVFASGILTVMFASGAWSSGQSAVGTVGPPASTPPTLVTFGAGHHRIGPSLAPGRYFSNPSIGCYFERQAGNAPTHTKAIAFDLISFDAEQWVVDITATDFAFQATAECGIWSNHPRGGSRASLPPGMWVVPAQVRPGTYRTSASPGCYWERVRDYTGSAASVIARELIATSVELFVTVRPTDGGYTTNASCGTWTATNESPSSPPPIPQ